MALKLGIHGFGRIGRAFFRLAAGHDAFEIAAIVDLAPAAMLAHLLKYDTVHGRYPGDVRAEGDTLIVDGRVIPVLAGGRPVDCRWGELGVWGVLESTGRFTARDDLAGHLAAGARKAVLSSNPAPADHGRIKTFVLGVNDDTYDPDNDHAVSNASCTTNCLAPVLKVLDEHLGVREGLVTTIHAYTQDQNLVDGPHHDLRRARAAALNMVPTTTGATDALALVLPQLAHRFRGLSVRVPTANVSLADLNVLLGKTTTAREINELMRDAAAGPLRGILEITDEPLVSGDLNGCRASATLDASETMVAGENGRDGELAKLMLWYDNETGYAARLVDLFEVMIQREKEATNGDQVR